MQPVTPLHKTFARGYPAALSDLRSLPEPVEPDIALGLFALLHSAGMSITYADADVLSGHASQFLYHRERPDCAQISFVPPTDTLYRALDVTWKEVTPSGPSTAYQVVRAWVQSGRLVLARLKEPLLVYGTVEEGDNLSLMAARLWARLSEETIGLMDCDRRYWRYPLDEANVLVCVEEAPHSLNHLNDLIPTAARRAVRAWHTADLAGCASGDVAYRRLAADVADPDVDFSGDKSAPWMGAALWRQWTSRASLSRFFERSAPRFGGRERNAVAKAAFCYAQCMDAWNHFAGHLGPTWNIARAGFSLPYPDDFVARWRNRELRIKASGWIEEARGWEEKAVAELTHIIR